MSARSIAKWAVRIVVSLVFVLIVMPTAYFLYHGYAPGLLLNPITRYLYSLRDSAHGSTRDLVPHIFAVGDSKETVVANLLEAGFEPWHNYHVRFDPQTKVTDIFHIWAGGNIACGYEFFVELQFDQDQSLLAGEAVRDGACL